MSITAERWQEAQTAEAAYWRGADRAEEMRHWHWYAGLLRLTPGCLAGLSVTEIACGPHGLTRGPWRIGTAYAVDPLRFAEVDEAGYQAAGVQRVVSAAEDYAGPVTDEVWGANVLQHVRDPLAVLGAVQRTARSRVRWFDWIETPVTTVHPHSLAADWLDRCFDGWRCVWRVDGMAEAAWAPQRFAARIWERA